MMSSSRRLFLNLVSLVRLRDPLRDFTEHLVDVWFEVRVVGMVRAGGFVG